MPRPPNGLTRAVLAILFAFLGLFAGTAVGGLFVPEGSGLAGPAIALGYGLAAGVGAFVLALVLGRRLGATSFAWTLGVAAVLSVVLAGWFAFRVNAALDEAAAASATPTGLVPRPDVSDPAQERPDAGPAASQRYPFLERRDLPAGLGVARIAPYPGLTLRFHPHPGEGQTPGDFAPSDSVTFRSAVPSVDIATAPPWLVPEHLKMDYELFEMRVLTLTPEWMEVIGNTTNGESWWISRADATFVAWPERLVGSASVETFDEDANPVRTAPTDEATVLSASWAALPPLAIQGDWMKVATINLADRIPPSGWVRWREDDRLLVTYSPFE